jgi:hypothetical protein
MPGPTDARIGFKPYSYDDTVPSVRLRALLPNEALRRAGFRTVIVPPDGSGTYDCVVFQKTYEERDMALAERLAGQGVRLVFDLCDNHFYDVDPDPVLTERADRLRRMIDCVDLVTISLPGLAELVAPKPTLVVDDALEVPRVGALVRAGHAARRRLRHRRHGRVRLVWFGHSGAENPPFGMVHLGALMPRLEELHRTLPLELTVISNSRPLFDRYVAGARVPTRYVPWSSRTFARHFGANDICVLPIEQNAYTIYKTHNRVRTSLLLGVPVVASEIPSYREFADWVLFDDWAAHIDAYARDPGLGRRHVEGARAHILRTYTPEHLVGQWSEAFATVLDRRAPR